MAYCSDAQFTPAISMAWFTLQIVMQMVKPVVAIAGGSTFGAGHQVVWRRSELAT